MLFVCTNAFQKKWNKRFKTLSLKSTTILCCQLCYRLNSKQVVCSICFLFFYFFLNIFAFIHLWWKFIIIIIILYFFVFISFSEAIINTLQHFFQRSVITFHKCLRISQSYNVLWMINIKENINKKKHQSPVHFVQGFVIQFSFIHVDLGLIFVYLLFFETSFKNHCNQNFTQNILLTVPSPRKSSTYEHVKNYM